MSVDGWTDFRLRICFGGQGDTGFTQFVHRWYDSSLGKWISRDPIGVEGGVNVYNYTENNPVNNIDPIGLCEEKVIDWKCVDDCVWSTNYRIASGLLSGEILTWGIAFASCIVVVEFGPAVYGTCVIAIEHLVSKYFGIPSGGILIWNELKSMFDCISERCVIEKWQTKK